MQPTLPFGRAVAGRESGQYAFQSLIYLRRFGVGKNAYRAGDRHGNQAAQAADAGVVRVDEQIPGAVPERRAEGGTERLHSFLSDARRPDYRRYSGTGREG